MSAFDPTGTASPSAGLRELPDRELVVRCQRNESGAFDELVARHQDRVFTAVTRF